MNPSGRGWITKLLKLIESGHGGEFGSLEDLYLKLREVGFLYGSNITTLDFVKDNSDYTKEERCKINLLIAFYAVHNNIETDKKFENSLIDFYKDINFNNYNVVHINIFFKQVRKLFRL